MKAKFILVGILILSVAAICTAGSATTYSAGVQAGDEWILEVTLIDEEGLVDAFLNEQGWKMNVKDAVYYYLSTNEEMTKLGAQFKIIVNEVTESEDRSTLDITLYDWTLSGFSMGAIDSEWRIPKDPASYYWTPETLFVGSPVDSYLAAMSITSIYEEYVTIQGNVVVYSPWEDITYKYTYDSTTGGWVGLSILHNNQVIYTIGLGTAGGNGDDNGGDGDSDNDGDGILSGIPGYDVLFLLGSIVVISLGLGYTIKKKHA